MVGVLNGALLALMTSIGRQTGLFEAMAGLPPSTSEAIAAAAGLERALRPGMAGRDGDGRHRRVTTPARRTYVLPPEHAAVLTSAAGARNMARFMQYVPMLAEVEADVIHSFRSGGGVPYERYPRFQALMAESSGLRFDHLLLQKVVPLTGLADGARPRDRRARHRLRPGARRQPAGARFPAQPLHRLRLRGDRRRGRARRRRTRSASRTRASPRATWPPSGEPEAYDLITAFDVIHDQAKPHDVLREVARALRPDGTFLMVDVRASSDLEGNIGHPLGPFLYGMSTMHCMTVSLALGGAGLGTVWGEEKALAMLREAGFASVAVHRLGPDDPLNNYYVARKTG